MTRVLAAVAALSMLAACGPKEPGGQPVKAAERTVPAVESLPAAERATPLLPDGAPSVEPALDTGDQLGDTRWEWLYTQTPVEKVAAPAPKDYTLEFAADGRVTGRADCNRMSGTYQADAKALTFSPLATTRMACPPGSLGDRFARDLGFVRNYFLVPPDTLRMDMQADGGTLTFRRVK
jgi:heat shock protein HslJ